MKYRIVRRWTTKTNKLTGKIVEQGEDQFYIQYRNLWTIISPVCVRIMPLSGFDGGWKDLHLFPYSSFEEAQQALNERLERKAIKEEKHEQVVFTPYE